MTDLTDFERVLERRIRAHAATVGRPVSASEVARSTIAAAAVPARGSMLAGPWRPIALLGVGAMLLLSAVVGVAILGQRTPTIHGLFTEGPSLSAGRIADAVVLPDGRILVSVQPVTTKVPGTSTFECEPPCRPHLQVLDPRTEALAATATPPAGLAVDAMALLPDGRVLLLGPDESGSATVYDPVGDRFEAVGGPLHPWAQPFLVTLVDGRVLIGGGEADTALATAELFDPATGAFSSTGHMSRPRIAGATATLLADGRVLVLGGGPEVGPSAELYDPATGTFAETGSMTVARGGFQSATLLADGRVLVVGGLVPDPADPRTLPDPTATAEIYDPATARFTAVGSMAAPRFMHAASILADGTVLVAGGAHDLAPTGLPGLADDAEIFDPATGTFRPTGDLQRARLWPTALPVDDRVLILGSLDPSGEDLVTGATTEWFE